MQIREIRSKKFRKNFHSLVSCGGFFFHFKKNHFTFIPLQNNWEKTSRTYAMRKHANIRFPIYYQCVLRSLLLVKQTQRASFTIYTHPTDINGRNDFRDFPFFHRCAFFNFQIFLVSVFFSAISRATLMDLFFMFPPSWQTYTHERIDPCFPACLCHYIFLTTLRFPAERSAAELQVEERRKFYVTFHIICPLPRISAELEIALDIKWILFLDFFSVAEPKTLVVKWRTNPRRWH